MKLKAVSGMMLTLLLVGALASAFNLAIAGVDEVAGEGEFSSSAPSAPPSLVWNKTYGGDAEDHAYCVRQTSDGGYILVGYTYSFGAGDEDVWLVKADANGNVEWNKTYGGADGDFAFSVQQTTDGGYILTGYCAGACAVKTDAYGNIEWNITSTSFAKSVWQTSDGGYILAGHSSSWLVKIDSNGSVEWKRDYNELIRGCNWFPESVQQTSDGGYMVVGEVGTYKPYIGYKYHYWLAKTDAGGNMEWNKTFGEFNRAHAYSGQQTTDGGYMLAGTADNAWLVKTDSYGNMEWNASLAGEAFSGQQTSDEGYILAGKRSNRVGLMKTDVNGNMEWNRTYGEPDWVAESVQQTSDGEYIVAGFTHYWYESPPSDFFLMKLGIKHDVAVTNVQPSKSVVAQNDSVSINVTVENQGNSTEIFNVTAYAGTTAVDIIMDITLTSGNFTTVTFDWNTTGFIEGVYPISATVAPVPGEVETADNTYVGGLVMVGVGPPGNLICVNPPLTDNLKKGSIFVVEVWINISDTAGVPGNPGCFDYSYSFYWNDALLEIQSYKAYPPQDDWNQGFWWWTYRDELNDMDGDTKNDTHRYRVIAIGNAPGLTGFRKIMDYTFKVVYQPVLPEPNITSTLDIWVGTFSFTDFDGHSIPMSVYDGIYQILSVPALSICDLNDDGRVTITDIVICALAFGSKPGDPNWNLNADLNSDGKVTIADIVFIAIHFGETY